MSDPQPRFPLLMDVGVALVFLGILTADSRAVAVPVALVVSGLVALAVAHRRHIRHARRSDGTVVDQEADRRASGD